MEYLSVMRCVRGVLAVFVAAIAAFGLATPALAQWPTTCVDLNDIVETHLGNDGNVGIYQRVFGGQAEQGCQNDHRDDVRGVFGWAFDQTAQSAGSETQDLAWPTDCVELNDIVENHLGNQGNVGIYQRTFGAQAEGACRNDHRDDVRGVFGWAFGGATVSITGLPLSADEMVARNQGAVRYIHTGNVCGSGAVVTQDGYVVTNRHVVEDTSTVQVGTHQGQEEQAQVVARHSDLDLALLKLSSGGPHPFVAFDHSADLRLGEDLVILGYPLCLQTLTITRGVLSARHPQVFQTDATANPGHSGSPGFNSRGGVIGVVTSKWGENVENTNFLIESDVVRPVIDDWIIRHRAGILPSPTSPPASQAPASSGPAPSIQPDYDRVRQVAVARGAPEGQADGIAASVIQRGTVDAFLRGVDDGVEYGSYDCRWQSAQCPLAPQKPDHPEYDRIRQVAIARGAPESQADDIAISVIQRGAVDAFLRGIDDGVQYGRYHCQWQSAQCPLSPRKPLPPPSDISGRGEMVSDFRQIDAGNYVATITWSDNGWISRAIGCFPQYFQAYLYDLSGQSIDLSGWRYGCSGASRASFTVVGDGLDIYVSVTTAHERAQWTVSFQRVSQ